MGENEQKDREEAESVSLGTLMPEEIINRFIKPIQQDIANLRGRCFITFYYPETEYGSMEARDVSTLRYLMTCENCPHETDLFIHSHGGDIHAAYKLAKLFQKKCRSVNALIPEYAKSAATLLAIGCNKIEFSAIAEIGPLDPIVFLGEQPGLPGFAVRDAPKILEEEIQSCEDEEVRKLKAEFVIGPMAAKMNPYFLTAVKNMSPLAHTYGKKLLNTLKYSNSVIKRILKRLVYESGRASHGYVIDVDEAEELGLNSEEMNDEIEEKTLTLLQFLRVYEARLKTNGNPLKRPIINLTRPSQINANKKPSSEKKPSTEE